MTLINMIQLLALSISILSTPSRAFGYVQDYESDLDTVLCQSVHPMQQVIVDIRASMDRGADLIDGKWVKNLDSCISQCCGEDQCDIALYKTEGVSSSGKNCYFVNCGDSPSNCVLVNHDGFSSVRVEGRQKTLPDTDREINSLVPSISTHPPQTTTPPPTLTTPLTETTEDVKTTKPTVENKPTTLSTNSNSDSHSTTSDSITAHSDSNNHIPSSKEQPSKPDAPVGSQNEVKNEIVVEENFPESPPNKGGSGLIAVAIVGVICFIVVVIVVGVLAKKVFNDQRKKRFRNVDYLINGMYT